VAGLGGTFGESSLPGSLYICARPGKLSREFDMCIILCLGLHLYPSDGPVDLLRAPLQDISSVSRPVYDPE
jgi:hypothetical protein